MPIPPLDQHGFLPVGVHECSLRDVKSLFGTFQWSDRRPKLFEKLSAFVADVRGSRVAVSILIDGSFVTAKPTPNDIDVVVVLPRAHDFSADLDPSQYQVVSKRRVQSRYGFDIVVVREGTIEFDEAVEFFTQVRHLPQLRKGLLKLIL